MGHDHRIGSAFLDPGPGWGGSCLPKDTAALVQVADGVDFEFRLLRAAMDTNARQVARMLDKIRTAVTGKRSGSLNGCRVALLGLTFKAGTDDLRDSPALAVSALLRQCGAVLVGHDPAVVAAAAPQSVGALMSVVDDPYEAVTGAEVVVVLTEWPQFRALDWTGIADLVKERTVVDTRNVLDPDTLARDGFAHHANGTAGPTIGAGRGSAGR